jgi:hypothetical protein
MLARSQNKYGKYVKVDEWVMLRVQRIASNTYFTYNKLLAIKTPV